MAQLPNLSKSLPSIMIKKFCMRYITHLVNNNPFSEHLHLNECSLSGVLPADVGLFSSLSKFPDPTIVKYFFCEGCLSYMSVCVCLCFTETLELDLNFFEGFIPIALGDALGLESLRLGTNLLSGTIPSELAQLLNLTNFELQNNFLTGTIPTEFDLLTNLDNFDLTGNFIG
jgi:Leucine-rich repeat (LRR) protein